MSAIAYTITIGSASYSAPESTSVQSFTVHNALGVPVSSAEIVLAVHDTFKPGDAVAVTVGGGLTGGSTLFTGAVRSVAHTLQTTTVYAASGMEALTRLYVDALYEQQSCGAIFKDLAGQAGAATGTVSDGPTFPTYAIASTRSAWQHLQLLAKYTGADVYTDADDQFHFATYQQSTGATFTYGENILEVSKEAFEPAVNGVVVFGDSPGGDEDSTWFKKEEVKGTAGKSEGTVYRYAVYAARSTDLCTTIAENLFAATQVTARGTALVLNGQEVALGSTITLKDVPDGSIDGSYKVTGVRHNMSKQTGYTTEVHWEQSK